MTNNTLPIHESIRILLINENKEILLVCADDPTTTTPEGTYNGKFWFTPGGEIEPGEAPEQTAIRELFEETGLTENHLTLGPIVWFGEFELVLSGTLTLLKQQFIVAHTQKTEISPANLTEAEKKVIKELRWFSLEDIHNSPEIIYPTKLKTYLLEILNNNYPSQPQEVDLS